jgi:hypothetical protein
MRLFTNLLFKVTLSSMILTAPAMITGKASYEADEPILRHKEGPLPFFTATVIRRFVDHPSVTAMRAFPLPNTSGAAASDAEALPAENKVAEAKAAAIKTTEVKASESKAAEVKASEVKVAEVKVAEVKVAEVKVAEVKAFTTKAASAKAAELRMVINQAVLIYSRMDLQNSGLDEKAFEYAWRGYYNLLKKGIIHKKAVLSICDFSQSSRNKRMYVIDVQHKKLLYRTYVAHGQNSGDEFASSFSNDNDSYKSSLGFYVTQKTYVGRNGLSLRLDGVDMGYNDQALKRKIVLHGSSYVGEKYMQDYGNLGTSLGCPALPAEVSGRIIRAVKDGSCLFIYHPTQQYLDNSMVLHG